MLRALTALPLLLLAVVSAAPASAQAASVAVEGDEVVILGSTAGARMSIGESRGIEDGSRVYTVSDQDDTLLPGDGCERTGDERNVRCALPGGAPARRIRAEMGGYDDLVRADGVVDTPVLLLGGPGTDFLIGGAGADRLEGGPGPDTLAGDEGLGAQGAGLRRPDEMLGGDHRDRVVYDRHGAPRIVVTLDDRPDDGAEGEGDNVHSDIEDVWGDPAAENVLTGSADNNLLVGGPLADTLTGEGGGDRLDGAAGGDAIFARDGRADSVECADGADFVVADRVDFLFSCEAVDVPPPPPGPANPEPPPPTPPGPPPFDVGIEPASVRPSAGGVVILLVACRHAAGAPDCAGRLGVRSAKRVRIGRRRKALTVGAKAFRIPAGATARVAFRLSEAERRALRRARRIGLVARAVEAAAQPRVVERSLTLRRR